MGKLSKIKDYDLIGWRENVSLTKLKLNEIRAKIDTGAKTSALHAYDIEFALVKNIKYVKFKHMDDDGVEHVIKSPFLEERIIKSSNGEKTLRPVIVTEIKMGEKNFLIEVTLIDRGMMGFKMLIGREALKDGKFVINPAKQNLLKKKTKPKTIKSALELLL